MLDRDDLVAPIAERGMAPPRAAADLHGDGFAPVLQALLAQGPDESGATGTADAARAAAAPVPTALRRRLFARVLQSAAASRALHTRRHADTVPVSPAPGVTLRSLYEATPGIARRPGEPEAVTLVELAPGAVWPACTGAAPAAPGLQREWLVLRGSVQVDGITLAAHDYHVVPAGVSGGAWASRDGALVYLRQARPGPGAPAAAVTQHATTATWDDYAAGIRRRVLWRQGRQAAMLYHAQPGAAVPHHGHQHDEECLMLAGDFFLDEVLLRRLDYQVAPAGTEHRLAHTDTGVVIYAHGDIDLDVR
ncbi:MAG: cupin domain-containing protein [Rubrivivax sp.]|nr:cupin domain-containing protein [Rubrivivax sp.]